MLPTEDNDYTIKPALFAIHPSSLDGTLIHLCTLFSHEGPDFQKLERVHSSAFVNVSPFVNMCTR